ncbi:GAF domain-containing sensor histidine kinase [Pseudoalteromonas denitrificans]|uniref:histidine kinase n=1 Tax=Pseudoalteromonas denitrificans DSM 6059 TaxID=1123010 RepID=A0A1I1FQT5_9GAMM|nr:GAF domain-containing sensor histidine kinase [Pseudoalteromonas denitrificans]SFC01929.1 Histidine kinase-, DNA gyrase B-, and HSP90-like ATPase [Pseudoalteromonas denitrificans DSM 6059]
MYCEHVIKNQKPLEVVNALTDPNWCNNPDIALDMIYYYGVPLNTDDNESFGTLCVLDKKERTIEPKFIALINEIKKGLEAQLLFFKKQQKQADERALSSIDSLVWGMAHHLNTPIGLGITCLSVIQDNIASVNKSLLNKTLTMNTLSNQLSHMTASVELAQKNLKITADLVDEYREISIQQNKDEPLLLNLKSFFENITKTRSSQLSQLSQLSQENISVKIRCDANLKFNTCPNLIFQVVNHLIQNSILYAFINSTTDKNIEITISHHENTIHIKYSDNGCGIAPELTDKIFDPFFTTDMKLGHGLGLSVVKKIITMQLAGDISLGQSSTGVCFDIVLPIKH